MKESAFSRLIQESQLDRVLMGLNSSNDSILFIDYCRVRDKYEFIENLANHLHPTQLVMIDGTQPQFRTKVPGAHVLTPPPEIYYLRDMCLEPSNRYDFDFSSEALEKAYRLYKKFPDARNIGHVDFNIVRNSIKVAYLYTLINIRVIRPKLVIIWNAFHPLSQVAVDAAKVAGVPVCFCEYGVLPGTVNLDFMGQMGESSVALCAKEFDNLPVSRHDEENAKYYLEFAAGSGLNRRPQNAAGNLLKDISMKANGRKVVLFAGNNDLASGLYPYDERTQRFHSPIFRSSAEAAQHVFEISREKDWFVVYKPHPFFRPKELDEVPEHVLSVGDVDINTCIDVTDLTVTVLSQVAYIATIRGKPVLTLGHQHLRDKGIVYEVGQRENIAPMMERALSQEITCGMQGKWIRHVAQILRYYAFRWDDNIPPDIECLDTSDLAARLLRVSGNAPVDFWREHVRQDQVILGAAS